MTKDYTSPGTSREIRKHCSDMARVIKKCVHKYRSEGTREIVRHKQPSSEYGVRLIAIILTLYCEKCADVKQINLSDQEKK